MDRQPHWAASFTLIAALAAGTVLIALDATAQTDAGTATVPTPLATPPQSESTS